MFARADEFTELLFTQTYPMASIQSFYGFPSIKEKYCWVHFYLIFLTKPGELINHHSVALLRSIPGTFFKNR